MVDGFQLGGTGADPAVTIAGQTVSYAELHSRLDRSVPAAGVVVDLAGWPVVDALVAVFAAARSGTAVLVRSPDSDPVPLPEIPEGALLVAMTSGTAAVPRAVVRTAGSWSASFGPFAELTGLSSRDTVLLTGPLHSTLHLFAAVHTLWLGAHLTDDPAAATAAHAVPPMLADLLDDLPPTLQTVIVAGAALPPGVESRALESGLRLAECYGAAELSFVAARIAPAPLTPFPDVEIRVEDGELWARSPFLAMGRINPTTDPALQDLRRRDGFATVGDLAVIDPDGSIRIRGRGHTAVTTGGHTVLVEDVEAALAAIPGVRAVAVVGVPHARLGQLLTAVVELTVDAQLADVRKSARLLLAGPALPRAWRAVGRLPRTGGGKIARFQLTDHPIGAEPSEPAAPSTSVR